MSRTFLAPLLHHVTWVLAPVSHIHTFSWRNIANASSPFAFTFDTSISSCSGSIDASDTSTLEDAASVFEFFSLYQAGAFSGNFLKHPASLCPFKPQKLHVLLELVLPSLSPLTRPPCNSPLRFLHSLALNPHTLPQFLHFPLNVPSPSTEDRCTSLSLARPRLPLFVSRCISETLLHSPSKSGLLDFNSSRINRAYDVS